MERAKVAKKETGSITRTRDDDENDSAVRGPHIR
jgi:hypothetical protein